MSLLGLPLADYQTHMFNVHFIGSNDTHFLCILNHKRHQITCGMCACVGTPANTAFNATACHLEFRTRDFTTIEKGKEIYKFEQLFRFQLMQNEKFMQIFRWIFGKWET